MVDQKKAGMISGMSPLAIITGDELMEVSSRQSDGTWKTFSILINKIRTNQGLSAYEIAVKNGFQGTEKEWLVTLEGKSAYEVAVDLGYTGTEAEWLKTLVGPSAYQAAVAAGFNGTEAEWLESLKGKSAYQIAVANGFRGTETEWLSTLVGKSAYDIALEIDPTIGTEAQWLASLVGDSAYRVAVKNGFVGTEAAWLDSLKGKSAYQIWIAQGNTGNEADFVASLKGEKGADGKSAFELWQALPGNEGKTEAEYFESQQAQVTRARLQELLDEGYYTTAGKFAVEGANSGLVSNAGFHNFLFLFDKRLNNTDNSAPDKVPQRLVEMSRMEAEGYSYWKNDSAPTDDPAGKLPAVPDSEVRLYDDGRFEIGSRTDFISFGDGSKVTVTNAQGSTVYDLAEATQGKDGKSAYQVAVDNGFVGNEAAWLLSLQGKSAYQVWESMPGNEGKSQQEYIQSLKGANGTNGTNGADGKSSYEVWLTLPGNAGKTEAEYFASLKGADGENGKDGTNGTDGQSAYQLWLTQPGNAGKTEADFLKSLEGKSAYQVWLSQGNTGDEAAFIASLKGERGSSGLSAYQIWVADGNVGNEAAFLESLKGEDGKDGTNGTNGIDGKSIQVVGTVSQEEFDEIVAAGDSTPAEAYFVKEFMYVYNGTEWVKSNSLQGPDGKGLNYLGEWPTGTPLPLDPNYVAGDTYIWGATAGNISLWTLTDKPTRRWVDIGVAGPAGASAYQIWLDAGNTGTVADYLASLKGAKGDQGDVGPDGKSAYQLWLALPGNAGKTEAEFFASLKGAKGDAAAAFEIVDQLANVSELPRPGNPTEAYYVGKDLYVWFTLKDDYENLGSLDGASAYQIWLSLGNTGTETDFINSLKGTNGTNGTDGTNGTNGKSAYELAVEGGFVGTEPEWLASLKGKNLQVNGTQANEAAIKALPTPANQDAWVANDTGHLWIYNGTAWVDAGPFRGAAGADGTNGKSAYEIWVAIPANAGKTEAEFLASLKGADGTNGTNGTNGRNVVIKGAQPNLAAIQALPSPAQQDAYTALDTEHLYMYIGTTWTDLGQFKGDQGDVGPAGERGQGINIVAQVDAIGDLPASGSLNVGDAVYVLGNGSLYQVNDAGVYGPGIFIQGLQGEDGPEGPEGPAGTSIKIMGSYATAAALIAAHPTGVAGEGYLVGDDLYLYGANPVGGATEWYNAGPVRGPKGDKGDDGPRGLRGMVGLTGERGSLWLNLPTGTDVPASNYGRPGDWAVNKQFDTFYRDEAAGWLQIGRLVAGDVNSPLLTAGKVVRLGTDWVPLPVDAVPTPELDAQYVMKGVAGGKTVWTKIVIPASGVPEVPAATTVPQGRTTAGWVPVMAVPTGLDATKRYVWFNSAWALSPIQAAAPSQVDTLLGYRVNSSGVGSWAPMSFDAYSLLTSATAQTTNFTPNPLVQQCYRISANGGTPVTVTLNDFTAARSTLLVFTIEGNTSKALFVAGTGTPTVSFNNNVTATDIEYGANQTVITAFYNGFKGWIISKGPSY